MDDPDFGIRARFRNSTEATKMIEHIDRRSFTSESIFSELEEKHTDMIDTYYSFQDGLTLLKQLSFPSSRYPIAPDCEIPNSVIRGFWKEEKYEKEEETYVPDFSLGFISSKELLVTRVSSDDGETEDVETVSSNETKKTLFQKGSKTAKHSSKHKSISMLSKNMPEDAKNPEFVRLCHQLFSEIWFPPDCEIDFSAIIDQLIELLDTKDSAVHTKVCYYLLEFHRIKKIPPPKITIIAQKATALLSNESDPVIIINCIELLAGLNIKTDTAVSLIKSFLTSQNSDMRKASRNALRTLGIKQDSKYISQKESSSLKERSSEDSMAKALMEVTKEIAGNPPAKSTKEMGGTKKKTSKESKSQLKKRGSKGSFRKQASKKSVSGTKDQAGKESELVSTDQAEKESELETKALARKESDLETKVITEEESGLQSKDQGEKESELETQDQAGKEPDSETKEQAEKEPDSEFTDQAGKELDSDSKTADQDRKESVSKIKDQVGKEFDSKTKDQTEKEDGVKDQIAKESVSGPKDQAGKKSDSQDKEKMAKEIPSSSVEGSRGVHPSGVHPSGTHPSGMHPSDLQEALQLKNTEGEKSEIAVGKIAEGKIAEENFLRKFPGIPTIERDGKPFLLDTDTSLPGFKETAQQPKDSEETFKESRSLVKDDLVPDFKFSSKQPLPIIDDSPEDSPTKGIKIKEPDSKTTQDKHVKKQKDKNQSEADRDEMSMEKKQQKSESLTDVSTEAKNAIMQALKKQKKKFELDQRNRDKVSKLNDLKRNPYFLNKDAAKSSVGKKLVKRPTAYFLGKETVSSQQKNSSIDKLRSSLLSYSKANQKMGSFIREINAIDRIPKKSTMNAAHTNSMLDPNKAISDAEFQAQIQAQWELMEAATFPVQKTVPSSIATAVAAALSTLPEDTTGHLLGAPGTAIPPGVAALLPGAASADIPPGVAAFLRRAVAAEKKYPGSDQQLTSQEKEYGMKGEMPSDMQPSSEISNALLGDRLSAEENLERFTRNRQQLNKKRTYKWKDGTKINSSKQQLQKSDKRGTKEQEYGDSVTKELKMLSKEREIGLSKRWSMKNQWLNPYKSFMAENNRGIPSMIVAENRLAEVDDWNEKRAQRAKSIVKRTEESEVKKWVQNLPWTNIQKAFSNTLDQKLVEAQEAQRGQRWWQESAELLQESDHLKRGKSSKHLKQSTSIDPAWQSFLPIDIDTGDSLLTNMKDTDQEQRWSEIDDWNKKRAQRRKSITERMEESDVNKMAHNLPWSNIPKANTLDQRLGETQEAQRERRRSEGAELLQESDHLKRGKSSKHLKQSTSIDPAWQSFLPIDIDTGDSLLTNMKDTDQEQRWSEIDGSRAYQKSYGNIPSSNLFSDKAFYQVDKLSPWMRYHLQYKPERIEEEEYVPSFELKNVSQTPPEWFPKYRRMMFSPDFYQQREKWLNDYRRPTSIIY